MGATVHEVASRSPLLAVHEFIRSAIDVVNYIVADSDSIRSSWIGSDPIRRWFESSGVDCRRKIILWWM